MNKILSYKLWCNSWDIGGKDNSECTVGEIPLQLGSAGELPGFYDLKIVDVSPERVFLKSTTDEAELHPGETITLSSEIDGYEDHDGVLWGGDNYTLHLTWE